MPYVPRRKGPPAQRNLAWLCDLLEFKTKWRHGTVKEVHVVRMLNDIVRVYIEVELWEKDGSSRMCGLSFYAFEHVELAARKAKVFLEEYDKRMDEEKKEKVLE